MQGSIRRAAVVAAVGAAVLIPAGVASATASAPALSWSKTGTYDVGSLYGALFTSTTFVLANSGGSASSAVKINLTGSKSFSVTADTCTGTSLGPNKSCLVTVTYAPPDGNHSDAATLTATTNKPVATASLGLTGSRIATETCSAVSSPSSGPAGTLITDMFTLSGGDNPGGLLIIDLRDPNGYLVASDDVPVNGDGTYSGDPFTPLSAGNWQYTAEYVGDGVSPGCTAYSTFTAS